MEGVNYTCAVCGNEYDEREVLSTVCNTCNNKVCIYCTEYDVKSNTDYCDRCNEEQMLSMYVEAQSVASLPKAKAE